MHLTAIYISLQISQLDPVTSASPSYISAAGNTLYASISQNPLAAVKAYYAPCNYYVNPYYAYGFGYSKPILIYALGNLSLLKSLSMTGSIYGVVRSYRGVGVGGVEVVANLIGNNWVKPYKATTNGTEYYSMALPPGIYKLAFYPPQGSGLAPPMVSECFRNKQRNPDILGSWRPNQYQHSSSKSPNS